MLCRFVFRIGSTIYGAAVHVARIGADLFAFVIEEVRRQQIVGIADGVVRTGCPNDKLFVRIGKLNGLTGRPVADIVVESFLFCLADPVHRDGRPVCGRIAMVFIRILNRAVCVVVRDM